jgi:hypothetical protein
MNPDPKEFSPGLVGQSASESLPPLSVDEIQTLLKKAKPLQVSASVKNAVTGLVENDTNLETVVRQLKGKTDEHALSLEKRNAQSSPYPLEMTEPDITQAWKYYDLLRRTKQRLINRMKTDKNGKLTCFHGTTIDRLKPIRKEGLKPDQPTTGMSAGYPRKQGYVFVYAAPEIKAAKMRAIDDSLYSAGVRQIYPVVIQLKIAPSTLTPDLDSHCLFAYKISVEAEALKIDQANHVRPWKVLSYWWNHLREI